MISFSRHSSMSILDHSCPPNIHDLIPPPPIDEPPLCLAASHPQEVALPPRWHFHPQPEMFCCPNDELLQMETNFFNLENGCSGTLKKPRVRKLSSPSKRSQARNRNKGSMKEAGNSTDDGDAGMKSPRLFMRDDRCLSDNDGDDESEALNQIATSVQGKVIFF